MKRLSMLLCVVLLVALASYTVFAGTSTVMQFPTGVSKYVDQYGNVYYPGTTSQLTVTGDITPFLKAGFTLVPVNGASGSTTCTKNTWSNDYSAAYFCYSTNKQVKMYQLDRSK